MYSKHCTNLVGSFLSVEDSLVNDLETDVGLERFDEDEFERLRLCSKFDLVCCCCWYLDGLEDVVLAVRKNSFDMKT